MNVQIEESWKARLQPEFDKPYFEQLTNFVRSEYQHFRIYPPGKLIFNAFNLCPFDKVKVVLIGQDPYHEPGQAHGLCFSVNDGIDFPPSLVNIFKEIHDDTGAPVPASGNLTRWAQQGVSDAVIRTIDAEKEHVVFILWGSYAQKKGAFINRQKHLVLTSAHPSPLSAYRGFFGNHHFSLANSYLKQHNMTPIVW